MDREGSFSLLPAATAAILLVIAAACASSTGPGPTGGLVRRTDCKTAGQLVSGAAAAPTTSQECVEYEYDGQSVLRLKHVNAGFNCCPGTIAADIQVEGGAIRVRESESSSLCDCDCLYDLDYEFTGVTPGYWRIEVVGPYQPEGDPPLEFVLVLDGASSGSHCVVRTRYPWGY